MSHDLNSSISKLLDLIKAYKELGSPHGQPTLPTLPGLQTPSKPKMNPKVKAAKIPGVAPDSKKDPKKVAQQIKDGSMSTKTQKILLKNEECLKIAENGQWSLSSTHDSN